MHVLLCPTFDLALTAVGLFAEDGIRVVMAAPQGPGDRWMVVHQEDEDIPLFIGEDAWSCYMRSLCCG